MSLPLVTCVCLTKGNREHTWLELAIKCFKSQTYENRRLLIVRDNGGQIDGFASSDTLPLDQLWVNARALGAKRNKANRAATGEIILHWDDDDHSAPGRIADQVARLFDSGKQVTGYSSMKFVDENGRWWLYKGTPGFAIGTSLCYFRSWWLAHPFSDTSHVGEDQEFTSVAVRQRQLSSAPDLDYMYATIHSDNTCPRRTRNESCWIPLPHFKWRQQQ